MAFLTIDGVEDFLRLAFGKDLENCFITSKQSGWKRLGLKDLDPAHDLYWSPGAIPPGLPRSNDNVINVRAFVVDDVGTKVSGFGLDDLWRLMGDWTLATETSEGNFQFVWRLPHPIAKEEFTPLRRFLADTIQGAGDGLPPSHLFRLPGGCNNKPGRDHFRVRAATPDDVMFPAMTTENLAEMSRSLLLGERTR